MTQAINQPKEKLKDGRNSENIYTNEVIEHIVYTWIKEVPDYPDDEETLTQIMKNVRYCAIENAAQAVQGHWFDAIMFIVNRNAFDAFKGRFNPYPNTLRVLRIPDLSQRGKYAVEKFLVHHFEPIFAREHVFMHSGCEGLDGNALEVQPMKPKKKNKAKS